MEQESPDDDTVNIEQLVRKPHPVQDHVKAAVHTAQDTPSPYSNSLSSSHISVFESPELADNELGRVFQRNSGSLLLQRIKQVTEKRKSDFVCCEEDDDD
jgi:hypothetical protein